MHLHSSAHLSAGITVMVESFCVTLNGSIATDKAAIDNMTPGYGVTIFTPDDTHFDIALYAIRKGMHVVSTR